MGSAREVQPHAEPSRIWGCSQISVLKHWDLKMPFLGGNCGSESDMSDVLTLLSWLQNWDWFGMGLGTILNPKAPVCVQFFSLFNSSVPPVGFG